VHENDGPLAQKSDTRIDENVLNYLTLARAQEQTTTEEYVAGR